MRYDRRMPTLTHTLYAALWDLFCIISIVGIWPRFIEPSLLRTTRLTCKVPQLPPALHGFKIVQFSDLHLNNGLSDHFVKKLVAAINRLAPDLIVFTGDFLCYGKLENALKLKSMLNTLDAPHGCFAVLGNHDYAECVSVNADGDYDLIDPTTPPLKKAFKRIFDSVILTGKITDRARQVPFNQPLMELLKETKFKLLHNETVQVPVGEAKLNICGLGEYSMGRSIPSEAFLNYDKSHPGIVLLHNPDGAPSLKNYPGAIILSGHTHGAQVNLPWIRKKFTLLEHPQFVRGRHLLDENKQLYVNRGVGSVMPFRWFAPPELLLLTLE